MIEQEESLGSRYGRIVKLLEDERVTRVARNIQRPIYDIVKTLEEVRAYWLSLFGEEEHCPVYNQPWFPRENYLISAVETLAEVCKNEQEMLDGGKKLADLTLSVFGFGSHQYICDEVPQLLTSGNVTTKDELITAARELTFRHIPYPKV